MELENTSIRLHHAGVIVPNRERVDMLVDLLGIPVHHEQYVQDYEADCIFVGRSGTYFKFIHTVSPPRQVPKAVLHTGARERHRQE
ncbi:MAG: hypothetical protein ABSA77_00215 [Thermoguttaceae bacterium]|jgi:hypothetical protein